jgi:hypothetical protein
LSGKKLFTANVLYNPVLKRDGEGKKQTEDDEEEEEEDEEEEPAGRLGAI